MSYNYELQSKLHEKNHVINFSFLPLLADATKYYYVCVIDRSLLEEGSGHYQSYISEINELNFEAIFIVTDHGGDGNIDNFTKDFSAPAVILTVFDSCYSTITFPYWLLAYPKYYNINTNLSYQIFDKKYIFSCLTYRFKDFKAANLVKLHQSSFWDNTLISFHCYCESELQHGIDQFVNNGQEYYNSNLKHLLPMTPMGNGLKNLLEYSNLAHLESYVNIVLEHTIHRPFITEKIVKCFLAEQFFVVFGGVGLMSLLESYGFDIYRDIINHSRYDNIENTSDRLHQLYVLLEEIKTYNWQQIYKDTTSRREKNRSLILNQGLKELFDFKIKDHLASIRNKHSQIYHATKPIQNLT
jgi:hypothetical protein